MDQQTIRKGPRNFIHYIADCFWCKKRMETRYDVWKRQMNKYGHLCCKRCFGNEKSFKDAQQARTDNRSHPHTEETKRLLSSLRIGAKVWNKGLDKRDERVKNNWLATSRSRKLNPLKGSKNPNWKGGISSIKSAFDETLYKNWMGVRKTVLHRDCYTCIKCSGIFLPTQLHVHHLLSKTRYPNMKLDEDNCVTMCHGCHKKFHRRYGIKKFTPNNWEDFINEGREKENHFITC